MSRYVFDKDFKLRKVTNSVRGILMTSLKWLIATLSMAAFYYLCFSLLISTDEEKKLKRENRMYEKLYPEMQEKERKLQSAVLSIKKKYGKNGIVKCMDLQEGATMMERNRQIGGHRA